jgi:hypothetical protein
MARKIGVIIGGILPIIFWINIANPQGGERVELINNLVLKKEAEINKKLNFRIVLEGCNVAVSSNTAVDKMESLITLRLISPFAATINCGNLPDLAALEQKVKDNLESRWNFLNEYIAAFKSEARKALDEVYSSFNPLYKSDIQSSTEKYFTKEEGFINAMARNHAYLMLLKALRAILDEALGKTPEAFNDEDINKLVEIYKKSINIDNLKNKLQQDPALKRCAEELSKQAHNLGFELTSVDMTVDHLMNQVYKTLLSYWPQNIDYKLLLKILDNVTASFSSQITQSLIKKENQNAILRTGRNLRNFLENPSLDQCKNVIQNFKDQREILAKNAEKVGEILSIAVKPATITVEAREVSIAVLPPVIFTGRHEGTSSLAEITPERIFNEIRDFLFKVAPTLFILLLVVGAIAYLITPVNLQYIQTGSEYIKWAIIGYFLLLVVTGIISAVRVIFGGP